MIDYRLDTCFGFIGCCSFSYEFKHPQLLVILCFFFLSPLFFAGKRTYIKTSFISKDPDENQNHKRVLLDPNNTGEQEDPALWNLHEKKHKACMHDFALLPCEEKRSADFQNLIAGG
jgi:hypothetical protein